MAEEPLAYLRYYGAVAKAATWLLRMVCFGNYWIFGPEDILKVIKCDLDRENHALYIYISFRAGSDPLKKPRRK